MVCEWDFYETGKVVGGGERKVWDRMSKMMLEN